MPKSRKTREQKIAASQKHQQQAQHQQFTYTLNALPPVNNQNSPTKKTIPHLYVYTTKDLQKTFLISAFLIAAELILFFVLHQHVLKIPFAPY